MRTNNWMQKNETGNIRKMLPVFFNSKSFIYTGKIAGLLLLACIANVHSLHAEQVVVAADEQVIQQKHHQVESLANAGAPKLALNTLDLHQSKLNQQHPEWILWEKLRIRILRSNQQWDEIDIRLRSLPEGLPQNVKFWAITERAEALIHSGKSESALFLLRTIMWQETMEAGIKQKYLKQWRRDVLDAYMSMGKARDAYLASAHYFKDYNKTSQQEQLLHIRILLAAGYAEDATVLIKKQKKSNEQFYLSALAELRQSPKSAGSILSRSLRKVRAITPSKQKPVTPEQKTSVTALWAVIAEAAAVVGDRASQTNALEHVVIDLDALPQGLFSINADTLWQAYIDSATEIGNHSRLLIGQDDPWFKAAAKARKKQPVRSRSLYAFLSINAGSDSNREKAVTSLTGLLKQRKRGGKLMQQLYLSSERYQDIQAIPLFVRHALVGVALQQSNLLQASSIMATIKQPPENADVYFWRLRRARILVMGGEIEHAIPALSSILDEYPELTAQQYDQFLQVLFDLQTVQVHQEALSLFEKLLPRVTDIKLKRELYFWMAESSKALQRYTDAARFYMTSAMLPAEDSMDPWAQTARYQAAESLAKAGMVEDARKIFKHLLKVTKDPARRARLLQELQKLWLIKDRDLGKVKKTTTESGIR